jgi:DNA-binding transcriptional ArsR family regulator
MSAEPFPEGERIIPGHLLSPLQQFHQWLGTHEVTIVYHRDEKNKPTGKTSVDVSPVPARTCTWSPDAREAYYLYDEGLHEVMVNSQTTDIDGSYARFAEKALRVAALIAGMDNEGHIEVRHWARAQAITERWRTNLHYLIEQVHGADEPTPDRTAEDKIIAVLQKNEGKALTAREVSQGIRGISSGETSMHLTRMAEAGAVEAIRYQRTTRYQLITESVPCKA